MRYLIILLFLPTYPYPLELTSGYTNHPTILETSKTSGLGAQEIVTTTPKQGVTAVDGSVIVLSNQEAPTKRITIQLGALNSGATKAMVKVVADSVTFINVTGHYQIEETAPKATGTGAIVAPATAAPVITAPTNSSSTGIPPMVATKKEQKSP